MTCTDPQNPPPVDNRSVGPRSSNATPWVVAAVVAVVAIIAVAFMVTSQTVPEQDDVAVAQARDLGRAEGALAGAQSTLTVARDAASEAAARTSADAANAASDARAAADRAARSASDAATSATPLPGDTPPPQDPPM